MHLLGLRMKGLLEAECLEQPLRALLLKCWLLLLLLLFIMFTCMYCVLPRTGILGRDINASST